ncbi:MAG: phosphatidylglycerol lysyltransferase domain-containing protein [Candidatus Omnitrophica bacterium]|nr:phosphatidylglycerol lysyltransferase domain-containing protein [Candidatus Omnitrophota bacterium]
MQLKPLLLSDISIIDKYLCSRKETFLSTYNFVPIYVSLALYKVLWQVIDQHLYIFLKDKTGIFLYLPPLGKSLNKKAVKIAFDIMLKYNQNKQICRIENVLAEDVPFFEDIGYCCRKAFDEYVYNRWELASLRGGKFKHKRANVNYFTKHYNAVYKEFEPKDKKACLWLYEQWSQQRLSVYRSNIYQGLLQDSKRMFSLLLNKLEALPVLGRVVKIDEKICACSFGYPLSDDTFCIFFEIADNSLKGITNFIFQKFCQELVSFQWINCMDDSGLENIKRVKLSYHPTKLLSSFTVALQNE